MENDKAPNNYPRGGSKAGNGTKRSSPPKTPSNDQIFSKLPPQAIDLEEAVLGALMIEKDALTAVADILRPDSFYKESHVRIYSAIVTLFADSEPIDMLTVTSKLRSTGELELVGGASYIMELTSKVNSAANIEFHARIISQAYIKRELIKVASEIQRDAYEDTTDVFRLLDKTEQSLFEISESNIKKNYADMGALMRQALAELDQKKNNKDGLTGVPSGFSALDRLTSGWQKTELMILAARPGMGKTAFVVSSLRNAAVDFNIPVAIFSLEMSSVQLVNRLISAEAEIDSEKIRKGSLAPHEWEQLHHRIHRLTNAPIYIDDTPALSVLELRAKCRRLKAQHDIQMIVIDYLQLMTGDTGGKSPGNREQEIAMISRSLKNLAKELDVPVIALSQLSRAVETRGGEKRPQLSDLRESGSIEQDADMVIFLYRPEYYGITEDEAGNSVAGVGEVILAKNRAGSLDTIQLRFIGKYTKFADLDSGFTPAPFSIDRPIQTSNPISSFENQAKPTAPPMGGTLRSRANDLSNFDYKGPDSEPPF
ncbi:replicative DNA helicase [Dyadobacter fermentans]|uniref:Replicative DNA helicase n=1 Tax=Dyadobacter fermentans (strain ATCC 700827 / DSM 18053 / CIP 107007 / KCTC 52180 / NS114) TaxID=471854 RepID=C6W485_DYAFD|nr:replicative DNA helicase [Dyadobacter fermentans]ACT92322.1 replicative DNA helicase [Dyadobacter fermentans DSM 18053]